MSSGPDKLQAETERCELEKFRDATRTMLNNWRYGDFTKAHQDEPLYVRRFADLFTGASYQYSADARIDNLELEIEQLTKERDDWRTSFETMNAIAIQNARARNAAEKERDLGAHKFDAINRTLTRQFDDLIAADSRIAELRKENQRLRETGLDTSASLNAAISLLKSGYKTSKEAAPSDAMFDQMLLDYEASLATNYVSVPRKPTSAMLDHAQDVVQAGAGMSWNGRSPQMMFAKAWEAMITAASLHAS